MVKPKLKCVVVDDSSLQRLSISNLVKNHPDLELIAELNNALETKKTLENTEVDLVFLDIEMPILSGFDLLDKLMDPPEIIFVTGKTQYAFQAFNYHAIDYLQKPIDKPRFDLAVQKAIDHYMIKQDKAKSVDENYIFIKSNLKKYKLFLNNVKYVEAFGDYIKVVSDSETYTVLSTMKDFTKKLPAEQFMRIHKSYIANLFRIKHYSAKNVVIDEEELPVSRNRKKELEEKLGDLSRA